MKDIIEFAKDVLGYNPLPYQIEWLRRMEDKKPVIAVTRWSGRKTAERIFDEYQQFKKLHGIPEERISGVKQT